MIYIYNTYIQYNESWYSTSFMAQPCHTFPAYPDKKGIHGSLSVPMFIVADFLSIGISSVLDVHMPSYASIVFLIDALVLQPFPAI